MPQPQPLPTAEAPIEVQQIEGSHTNYTVWLPVIQTPSPVRGWAKAYSDLTNEEIKKLNIEWYYDYMLHYPFPQRDIEYIPFLWCDIYPSLKYDNPVINYFEKLKLLPENYSGYLLFVNEPDLKGSITDGGQCERTPRQVAHMLLATREICPKCIIVGPAISHEDYRANWTWLRAFYEEVKSLKIKPPEIAAIHTYLEEKPNLIIDSLFMMLLEYKNSPTKVWVTEFATKNPKQMEYMINFYKNDSRVERYAWFTARNWQADLITRDGELTQLGIQYKK